MSDVSSEQSYVTNKYASSAVGSRQLWDRRQLHTHQQRPMRQPPVERTRPTMTLWPTLQTQSDHRHHHRTDVELNRVCRHGSAGDSESRSIDDMMYTDIDDLACYADIEGVDDLTAKSRFDDQPSAGVYSDSPLTAIIKHFDSFSPSFSPSVDADTHIGCLYRQPVGPFPAVASVDANRPAVVSWWKPTAEAPSYDGLTTLQVGGRNNPAGGTSSSPNDVGGNDCHLTPSVPLEPCAECGRPITERYYLVVVGRSWHVNGCLRCSACRQHLDSHRTCFVRNGSIFCREDYHRLFTIDRCSNASLSSSPLIGRPSPIRPPSLCAHCQRPFATGALVMQAGQFVYHVDCFACSICGRHLQTGQQYALRTTKTALGRTGNTIDTVPHIYCRDDYELMLLERLRANPGHCGDDVNECALPVTAGTRSSPAMAHENSNDEDSLSRGKTELSTSMTKSRQRKRRPATGGNSTTTGVSTTVEIETENAFNVHADKQAGDYTDDSTLTTFDDGGCSGYHQHPNRDRHPHRVHTRPHQHVHDLQQHPSTSHHLDQLHQPTALAATAAGVMRQKRLRTSFKHHQLRIMKTYFALNHNPDAKDLKQLSQKTGLGKRILQVWFQNARAKYRRSVARQDIETRSGHAPGTSNGGQLQPDATEIDCQQIGQNPHNQLTISNDRETGRSKCGRLQQNDLHVASASSAPTITAAGRFHADLDHDHTTTNSVDSSISEFLNSSLSDDVM